MEIKKLALKDIERFIQLLWLFEEVFEIEDFKMPSKKHLSHLLQREDFIVLAALQKDKVLGGLTAYVLEQYYAEKPLVYLYDLAVLPHQQKQGIGKLLTTELLKICQETGCEEVFVQADKVDKQALNFYRSLGGVEANVLHFSYPLNTTQKT